MKLNRIIPTVAALVFTLGLTACASPNAPEQGKKENTVSVAVVQQMDHPSLDEIRMAVTARLEERGKELGLDIEVRSFNGNGDANQLDQIGAQIVSDRFDAVIPIASLAAQRMVNAVDGTAIPVICAAVSDPETTGVTGMDRVTGTSDALNTGFLLDMMLAQDPELKNVGLLYCPSEDSSAKPIEEAKAYLESKGIPYEERTGTNPSEVMTAAASLCGKVDAIFTPTDNTVAMVELSLAETFVEHGIPHYAGADSFVRNGAFATCGVNYTELGAYTADLALDVLQTGEVPPFHVMEGGIITVNTDTAAGLGVDYSVFGHMAGQVVEVTTTED